MALRYVPSLTYPTTHYLRDVLLLKVITGRVELLEDGPRRRRRRATRLARVCCPGRMDSEQLADGPGSTPRQADRPTTRPSGAGRSDARDSELTCVWQSSEAEARAGSITGSRAHVFIAS